VTTIVEALVGLPPWLVLLLVFALPAAEAGLLIGVFIPGETTVLLGGVVAHGGGLPLWAVIVAAAAGAATGDQVGFLLGRRYGNRLVDHLPAVVRRSGDLERALDLIRRRGAVAVALGRWAAVLATIMISTCPTDVPSGCSRIPETLISASLEVAPTSPGSTAWGPRPPSRGCAAALGRPNL
jgi:membrane-associated protein